MPDRLSQDWCQGEVADSFGVSSKIIARLMNQCELCKGYRHQMIYYNNNNNPKKTNLCNVKTYTSHVTEFCKLQLLQTYQPKQYEIRNRLKKAGLRSRRPVVWSTCMLTQRHRTAWLRWDNARLFWNRIQWRNVLSNDESRFVFCCRNGRMRIYRRRNES